MEHLLITVTFLSAGLAVAMGAFVVKMLRDERRRSDARVEALIAMVGAAKEPGQPAAIGNAPVRRSVVPPVATALPERTATPRVSVADDLDLNASGSLSSVSTLFAEPEVSSPWMPRVGIAAAVLAVVAIVATGVANWPSGSTTPAAGARRASDAAAPLELVSLGHTKNAEGLAITGVVQNPRGAATLSRITATAFLFAADGTLLGTGRAPLDFSVLQPGEESPFVIPVAVGGAVARYRIGFRDQDGRVIGHHDRREDAAVARREGS